MRSRKAVSASTTAMTSPNHDPERDSRGQLPPAQASAAAAAPRLRRRVASELKVGQFTLL